MNIIMYFGKNMGVCFAFVFSLSTLKSVKFPLNWRDAIKLLMLSIVFVPLLFQGISEAMSGDVFKNIHYTTGTQCPGYAAAIWVDADNNGTNETQVVVTTLTGEAYPIGSYGSYSYFISFIDSHCGGTYPYTDRGRFKIHFIDMLAPGFVWNNSSTWTYTRVSDASIRASHDWCTNGSGNPYLGVQAYRDLGQTNSISGTTAGSNPATHTFSDSVGIKEMYISTDFCENTLYNFYIDIPSSSGGSCQGKCGQGDVGGCYCDSQCVNWGDCCSDKIQICGW